MLGTELKLIDNGIASPASSQVDIRDYDKVKECVKTFMPDIVIHAAAITDNRLVEKNPTSAILTNIIGTANISIACLEMGVRLIYISTDYVYADGSHGNYKETDPLLPFNLYSATKLGGEMSVKAVPNHLIIRTSFGANKFPYSEAFIDKWSSKDYVNVIAPMIYEASLSPLTGVLNLGTSRKTLYAHAIERSEVNPVKIADTSYSTPYDTSLNLQKWMDYKSSKSIAKPHSECRVCGSKNMTKYLDLGLMPLANNLDFTARSAKDKERFPLQVLFCNDCALSQLSVVIDPGKMFGHYVYRSSINKPYITHCERMADTIILDENSFHIDIAGNDGALLKVFKDRFNHKVLNVDPAENLTAIAEQQGIRSTTEFWSMEVAQKIREGIGQADLITATNVFAHLDNVKEFIQACNYVLKKHGVLIIENPYLVDFIENMEFDTVYHEHVTYWSVIPMCNLVSQFGMSVINCIKQDIHGGTMRYVIAKDDSEHPTNKNVLDYYQKEQAMGYDKFPAYSNWSEQVKGLIQDFGQQLLKLKKEGYSIAGFAASAKGSTLLNCAGINTDIISWVADETPDKLGKFQPGTGIPIVHKSRIIKDSPDYLVILSWNFTLEIKKRVRELGYTGKFIIPVPSFEITD